MPPFAALILLAIASYLLGSLSFAVLVSRLMGLSDPREYGSGNPGATNVLRSGNKKAAAATLLLDAVKGWLPVVFAKFWWDGTELVGLAVAIAALLSFLGHLYPLYFGFKGGKGVATALGVLTGISPVLGLISLLTWMAFLIMFRYSSLASLAAAVAAPFYLAAGGGYLWPTSLSVIGAVSTMAALLLWRHRSNINRLMTGRESRVGSKK